MARTVIGLFDRAEEAHKTVQDLEMAGFNRSDISIVAAGKRDKAVVDQGGHTGDRAATGAATGAIGGGVLGGTVGLLAGLGALTIPGIGPILAAGPLVATLAGAGVGAAGGAVAGGLIGALTDVGVPEEEAEFYAEGLRRGGTLVAVSTDEAKAHRAAEIMQRHGAIDVDERSRQYGMPLTGATTATAARTTTIGRAATGAAPGRKAGEVREQIVEEQMQVGKRETERGGVRIYSRIRERPVEEQVRLREERVHVERRPADRPATEADLRAGQEEIIINERVEEPVVGKRARVVGEVVVSKEAQEHTETVRDKVRRKDVEVERVSGPGAGAQGFTRFEPEFRTHHQTSFGPSGPAYDQVSPAYRYGYEIGGDQRYKGREWDGIRAQAMTDWERRSPGTWERMEPAIRHGWERMRSNP